MGGLTRKLDYQPKSYIPTQKKSAKRPNKEAARTNRESKFYQLTE